jgi:hypothetical protein
MVWQTNKPGGCGEGQERDGVDTRRDKGGKGGVCGVGRDGRWVRTLFCNMMMLPSCMISTAARCSDVCG